MGGYGGHDPVVYARVVSEQAAQHVILDVREFGPRFSRGD
jgi:hypothetical protein